jgi:hypothetical protein
MGNGVELLPSNVLCHRLVRREAAPLEPAVRRFMEERFRADFRDVRIHAGPAARALCRALGARAFTWGRDIFFGEGQYAPRGPAGRRLLAHELVHVLQQRLGRSRGRPSVVPVGDPGDACEAEADRLAAEALGGGLRSAVSPDAAGALRRAVKVLADSARIELNREGVVPATFVNMPLRSAFFHLTKNADPIIHQRPTESEQEASAIHIEGWVDVEAGPRDNLVGYPLRFIQLVKTHDFHFWFAGRTAAEGSVSIDLTTAPGIPARFVGEFVLDSTDNLYGENVIPFMNLRTPFTEGRRGARVTLMTALDDHPSVKMPLAFRNPATGDDNYLYEALCFKEFLTALVVPKGADAYQILAHLTWNIIWRATFSWKESAAQGSAGAGGGAQAGRKFYTCQATTTVSHFYRSKGVKGAPQDTTLAPKIERPNLNPGETANALSKGAMNQLKQPGIWNVQASDTRVDPNIPDFFN